MAKKMGQPLTKQDQNNKDDTSPGSADIMRLTQTLADVSARAQPLMRDFMEKHNFDLTSADFTPASLDPMNMSEAYKVFMSHLMADPQKLARMQMNFWQDFMALYQDSATRFMGQHDGDEKKPLYEPEKGDRRFKAEAWQESVFFDFVKQSYLMTSRWAGDLIDNTDGLDDATRQKLNFYTKQYIDALSPSNFIMTNPEILQETLDSKGDNLIRGLKNLLADIERGDGKLAIRTTDYEAFEVGRNLATTPGKVIYQNELMQLIQYEPVTKQVHKRPLLIVPPWINKFYILDMKPENSFIKWLTEQGHTVFTISWVNPNRKLARKRFEDYMEQGVLKALTQIEKITGEPDCNAIGYCLGGTLLTATLGWLHANGQKDKIAAATFLTTLVDFEKAGELKLFIDDGQLKNLDAQMKEKGYLPGETIKQTFSLLRSNDLIWSFVVNNYLMGREPFPFDLLYWNDDSTNMPAAMHSFYLRKLYRDNLLARPGGVSMKGTPVDIGKIKTPCYFLSTKEDHIAPWQATYATTQLIKGPKRFILAASGHVAGVINPPAKNKYCYWTGDKTPQEPEKWLENAAAHDGSWWPDWAAWISEQNGGDTVPARKPGGGKLKVIEDAPGSYVKMKTGS